MYINSAHLYDFKCFGNAELELQYPGRRDVPVSTLANVNLVLGNNGGGKSSVLRAIAIAMVAPALMESGFVAHRLVRRPDADEALLKVNANLEKDEVLSKISTEKHIELLARIQRSKNSDTDFDRLHLDRTPDSPLEQLIYKEDSHAFFVVGYGATRRMETGDYSPSSERKRRGVRYGRVASLFEDQLAVRPLDSILKDLRERRQEATELINRILPVEVNLISGKKSDDSDPAIQFNGMDTPFSSLSDGYRAFVAMIADLIGHLAKVCPKDMKLENVPGVVLIDEVDLHLHPSWQRTVVESLAAGLPALQFVMTSHSPLVANSLQKENIFLTDLDENGLPTISQIDEQAYGRGIDQLLLSSYFGLSTTRPAASVEMTDVLIDNVQAGNEEAALEVMQRISKPQSHGENSRYFDMAKRGSRKHRS